MAADAAKPDTRSRSFPCEGCGVGILIPAGQPKITCSRCQTVLELDLSEHGELRHRDTLPMLKQLLRRRVDAHAREVPPMERTCGSCGAVIAYRGNIAPASCLSCTQRYAKGAQQQSEGRIPVDAVVPFAIDLGRAQGIAAKWIRSRWLAPGFYLRLNLTESLRSVYLPYWVFDAVTFTRYSGRKGEPSSGTAENTGTEGDEGRTPAEGGAKGEKRWTLVSGSFQMTFHDLPVAADEHIASSKLKRIEPWPLEHTLPATAGRVRGHLQRIYDMTLADGFRRSQRRMDDSIRDEVRRRVGGEPCVDRVATRVDAINYRHVLMPVWMLAVSHGGRIHQLVINGSTGELHGDRPWSTPKLAFAGAACSVLASLFMLWRRGLLF